MDVKVRVKAELTMVVVRADGRRETIVVAPKTIEAPLPQPRTDSCDGDDPH